ncbi:uncharacterized protein LOC129138329 isoform X1 [Pan troglodytes]|uniref:uncharacterized protein LOC129138329 isoform X1 n=1 Tax=Pan troglodytes TaxID=9598 RepID=UPI000046514D
MKLKKTDIFMKLHNPIQGQTSPSICFCFTNLNLCYLFWIHLELTFLHDVRNNSSSWISPLPSVISNRYKASFKKTKPTKIIHAFCLHVFLSNLVPPENVKEQPNRQLVQ